MSKPRESAAPHAPQALRAALGRFATGVTIIACRDAQGTPIGLTVNSFNALSLEPALVLWSLRAESQCIPAFQAASHFSVNVLAEGQIELSRRFARPIDDKFELGEWHDGLGGAPLLRGALAVFECRQQSHQVAGDHVLFIGEVLHLQERSGPALVYQGGHYRQMGELL